MNAPTSPNAKTSQDAQISHRAKEILDLITVAGGNMRIQSIATALDVSEETVRRNLKPLSEGGLVKRVHGGVYLQQSSSELSFAQRMDENPVPKQRIAAHIAGLISDGSSLFLDIGSTTAFIAKALRTHKELLVVTNSVAVAHTLAAHNNNRVFMPGGELRAHDGGIFGAQAIEFIRPFHMDFAVLSTAAINATNGFMLFDLEEAYYSRAIIERAQTRIIAADSSKFGRTAPISIGPASDVELLITDAAPPPDITNAARDWSTEIVVVD